MPEPRVSFHPDAAEEGRQAQLWYKERNPLAAQAFAAELAASIERITEDPFRWPQIGSKVRRYILPRFPFSVVYRVTDDSKVEIVAIAHHRRRPGYWRKR